MRGVRWIHRSVIQAQSSAGWFNGRCPRRPAEKLVFPGHSADWSGIHTNRQSSTKGLHPQAPLSRISAYFPIHPDVPLPAFLPLCLAGVLIILIRSSPRPCTPARTQNLVIPRTLQHLTPKRTGGLEDIKGTRETARPIENAQGCQTPNHQHCGNPTLIQRTMARWIGPLPMLYPLRKEA